MQSKGKVVVLFKDIAIFLFVSAFVVTVNFARNSMATCKVGEKVSAIYTDCTHFITLSPVDLDSEQE